MSFLGPTVRTTNVDLSADRIISAGSISIQGVVVANSITASGTGVRVEFEDNDTNRILTVVVGCCSTIDIELPFLADNGFRIRGLPTMGDEVFVTIYHTQDGA